MAEQMKPSGIDWIGDIPESWDVVRIKDIGTYRNGLTYAPEDITEDDNGTLVLRSSNIQNGKISYDDNVYVKCSVSPELMVKKGDIIICSRNGSRELIGKNAIIENSGLPCSFGAFMMVYRCSCPRYMYYILNSEVFSYYLGTFLTSTINQLTGNNFGNMKIVFCKDHNEQKKIVDFLDKECAQIDSIAADLEKQIALLQQYKKSLITETVTKGLDKSAPMKDSGVEWIGKIPEHWQKTRIKFEASIIGSGTTPDSGNSMYYDNGEHSWIQSGDLYGKDYIYETEKQLTNLAILECHALNWYTKDFVVVAMYGASVVNVAISKIDSFTNQACCVIKLNEKNDNRYLFYFLKAAQEEMLLKAFGGTQPNISQIIIKNLNFLNVPLLEQIEIADFLDSKCDMINEMLKSKKDQYDILIKHKKSLIYEYVTGKKRVKEVQ